MNRLRTVQSHEKLIIPLLLPELGLFLKIYIYYTLLVVSLEMNAVYYLITHQSKHFITLLLFTFFVT